VRVLERAAPDGAEEVVVELLRFLLTKEQLAAVGREGDRLVFKAAAAVLEFDDVPVGVVGTARASIWRTAPTAPALRPSER